MKWFPLFLFTVLFTLNLTRCQGPVVPTIEGTIQLGEAWKPTVYLVKPGHFSEIAADFLGVVMDSAAIGQHGRFKLTLPSSGDNTFYQLVIQPHTSRYPAHLLDADPAEANYMSLVVRNNESIHVSADADHFQQSFDIENPSADNQTILSLRDVRRAASIRFLSPLSSLEEHDTLLLEKEKAVSEYQHDLMQFADTTSSVYGALLAMRWVSPTNDYERIPEFILRQCQKWRPTHSNLTFVTEVCQAADKQRLPVLVGDLIPDYPMPLVSGDTVNLHALLGNKLTLVDIWASWCAPCSKENRDILVPLWHAWKEKGFQIIGYSIDANSGPWKMAIAKDGAVWPQASHLTGDSTPFLEALRISTIPANYLLDAGGKIIAKNLHGQELSEFVITYLSHQ